MEVFEIFHIKTETQLVIYNHYLAGYTIEDIHFIIWHEYQLSLSLNEINEIIDYLNYLSN